jgi:hypothetical protein
MSTEDMTALVEFARQELTRALRAEPGRPLHELVVDAVWAIEHGREALARCEASNDALAAANAKLKRAKESQQ